MSSVVSLYIFRPFRSFGAIVVAGIDRWGHAWQKLYYKFDACRITNGGQMEQVLGMCETCRPIGTLSTDTGVFATSVIVTLLTTHETW